MTEEVVCGYAFATLRASFHPVMPSAGWRIGIFTGTDRGEAGASAQASCSRSCVTRGKVLPLIFAGMAILFNPFLPVGFTKELWALIDLVAGFFWGGVAFRVARLKAIFISVG